MSQVTSGSSLLGNGECKFLNFQILCKFRIKCYLKSNFEKSTPGFLACASLRPEWQCNENNFLRMSFQRSLSSTRSGSGNPLKQTSRFSNQFSKSPFVAEASRFFCCASRTDSVIALAWDSLKPESFRFSVVPNVSIVKNVHFILRKIYISFFMWILT